MPIDNSLFLDVSDTLGMGNPAIVEKDYYVVALLKVLSELSSDTHSLVFSGGTALAKSGIKTHRMSEDVDIKIIPKDLLAEVSKTQKRKARRELHHQVFDIIHSNDFFTIESKPIIFDEYRYQQFDIRYPQAHSIVPCLRPFIKLELIETLLYDEINQREISSLTNEVMQEAPEVKTMDFTSIISTQAEKLISMLRRTASFTRDNQRDDDPALIRHIYDIYYIQQANHADIEIVVPLVTKVIAEDVARYGNQHEEFVQNPIAELMYGLKVLEENKLYKERFNQYVVPMVYGDIIVTWQNAFSVFKLFTEQVLSEISKNNNQIIGFVIR
ncbi:nucleotidyl transferase AbiEii/AbiGii toxin family protein [Glaciecola sp. 33A]|uniref:nucleotidyl transferase AbiEii/AbiGii toxin family protein n=1 Tax=Glaciecola sp. 33A TaxID=2057807 RepID=UPI0018E2AD5D|nr:nucleotidyl transferase AbiEii/AbiGii toxin family protein [Glaciecola sp. 33A]